jgi:hypothetical protein
VSYYVGAITERGAQVTDELDEIILSSVSASADQASFLLALGAMFSVENINL